MSCPECRPNRWAKLVWLGVVAAVLIMLASIDGAFGR